jgi:hypothetical protein
LTEDVQGQLALLVRFQWVAGKRAAALMSAGPFAAVIALTRRIQWFDRGASTNISQHHHAWVVFDHAHPTLSSGPSALRILNHNPLHLVEVHLVAHGDRRAGWCGSRLDGREGTPSPLVIPAFYSSSVNCLTFALAEPRHLRHQFETNPVRKFMASDLLQRDAEASGAVWPERLSTPAHWSTMSWRLFSLWPLPLG